MHNTSQWIQYANWILTQVLGKHLRVAQRTSQSESTGWTQPTKGTKKWDHQIWSMRKWKMRLWTTHSRQHSVSNCKNSIWCSSRTESCRDNQTMTNQMWWVELKRMVEHSDLWGEESSKSNNKLPQMQWARVNRTKIILKCENEWPWV